MAINNEAKYLLSVLGEAKRKDNPGQKDWAYGQAEKLGVDLGKAADSPQYIGQKTAQQQANWLGVNKPIDSGYSASIGTGKPYAPNPALATQTAAAQQKQMAPTANTSALRPTSQPINIPQLINTIMQYKQPMLNREQDALNRQAKGAAQFINQQFAGRGTLNSGQRISEQEKLQEATMQTLADLMARARAESVGEAYQFGGLQLQQQGQQFGQQESIANLMQRLAEFERGNMESDRGFGIQEAGLTGMYQGQPTMAGQKQDFEQMQSLRDFFIGMEDRASQEAGRVTPGLANWLGHPELAGKPLASLEAIEDERKFELEKIRAQGANSLAVAKEQQAGQNYRAEMDADKVDEDEGMTDAELRQEAIGMAQKDPLWTWYDKEKEIPATSEQRERLINQYINLLKGSVEQVSITPEMQGLIDQSLLSPVDKIKNAAASYNMGGGQVDSGVQGLIKQARTNGYSIEEIKQALQQEGHNPALYGF